MSYFKNNLKLKVTVFLLITALIFWLIPTSLIFGEGEEQGGEEGTVIEEGVVGEETTEEETTEEETTEEETTEEETTEEETTEEETTEEETTEEETTEEETTGEETVGEEVTEEVVEEPLVEEPVTSPVLSTDKTDYAPEETVVITGTGFLPNAVYTIVVTRPDGSVVIGDGSFVPGSDSVLSDAEGNFTYSYILDGILGAYQVDAIDVDGNTVASTSFTDTGNDITVHKFGDTNGNDSQNSGEPNLSGVQFKLERYYSGSWHDYGTVTTNSNGDAKWYNKPDGYYKVTELNTPSGYEPNTGKKWEGNIDHNKTINVPNDPLSCEGKVIVYKEVTNVDGDQTEFQVKLKINVPDDGQSWYYHPDGTKTVTDGNFVEFGGLPDGTDYIVEECNIPECYQLVDICYDDSDKEIEGDDDVDTVTVKNKAYGKIIVRKEVVNYDGCEDSFKIKLKTKYYDGWETSYYWLKNGESVEVCVPVGTEYCVEECYAPDCYTLLDICYDDSDKKIEWACDDDTIIVKNKAFGKVIVCKEVIHEGENGEQTDGIFLAVNGNGPTFEVKLLVDGKQFGEIKYLTDGTCVEWCGVPVGSCYEVVECNIPEGYSLNSICYDDRDQKIEWPCDDDKVTVKNEIDRGSIEIFKTDASTGLALGGSTFELQKEGSWITIDTVVLGPDGHYKWEDLPFGNYRVVETIAPPGYLLAPPVEVTLNSGNSEIVITGDIADPRIPGRVTVVKQDETGALLDGVGFTIYYKDSGNPVMPEKFTAGGLVTFDGLAWGTYIIKETTPPAGYDTSDPVEVTIGPDNAEAGVTITRIDTKTPPPPPGGGGEITVLGIQELPFTGMSPVIPISGASTIFAGGLMVMLSSIKRKFGRK